MKNCEWLESLGDLTEKCIIIDFVFFVFICCATHDLIITKHTPIMAVSKTLSKIYNPHIFCYNNMSVFVFTSDTSSPQDSKNFF